MALERVEASGQIGAVGLEPLIEFAKGFRAQAVEPALGVTADLDEAGVAQHLQVPGHARLVHADDVDELGHRAFTDPHGVEDPTTSRVRDHIEYGELPGHNSNIRLCTYMRKQMYGSAWVYVRSKAEVG